MAVAGTPIALVWVLRYTGVVTAFPVSILVGVGASLTLSQVGCRLWEKHPASEDLLFSELMLWGYLGRLHAKRRLASAVRMLGPMRDSAHAAIEGLSAGQRVRMLEGLVSSVETHDPYLHGHSRRVARHSWMVAKRMGLSRTEIARIRTAAALHDVGKINTPAAILHKPEALTDEEYAVIKRHPGEGAEMSRALKDGALTSIIRYHHERLDGSGYPHHLHGDEIPLGARIIAVADTFDAITSARPYRRARPHREALEILKREAGTKLDASVVRTFCAHYSGRRSIALSAFLGSLPERLLSTLDGSIDSAASVGKIVVASAVIGGSAAAGSAVTLPARHPRPARDAHSQASNSSASVAARQANRASPRPMPAAKPVHASRRSPAAAAAARTHRRRGAATVAAGAVSPISAPSKPASATVTGAVSVPAASGDGHGSAPLRRSASGSAKGSTKENGQAHGHQRAASKTGKTHGRRGKSERAHGRSEGAHRKSEGAHGKSEGPHGKSEAAHGKSEGAHGKSEVAPGKSEGANGKSEGANGKSEVARGKSEAANGKSEEANGKSEAAHGKSEEPHGNGHGDATSGGEALARKPESSGPGEQGHGKGH